MYRDMMAVIAAQDPDIARAMDQELWRQKNHIELIASENMVSPAVLAAAGSVLTNKYAEGYSGNRYYGGCEYIDEVELIAIERAKEVFGANYANVQPHSGVQANYAVYLALVNPGDVVMGMDLNHGGHLSHGSPANFSGKSYKIVSYGVSPETGILDYDNIRQIALEARPKMIIAGASAYPRTLDFEKFGAIAKEVDAFLMVDIAHIAGLVAAGAHPNPVPHSTVVTSTTHKTMRGPRGGMILCNDEEVAAKINSAIFPGAQGGPLMHIIAAKAIALGEALTPEWRDYQHQIVKNAKALADALINSGFVLVTGGTDNHLMLVDLRELSLSGKELEVRLDSVRITANKNKVPNDPLNATNTSGLRLGTPCVTTRGFKEAEMEEIAELFWLAVHKYDESQEQIIARVEALCNRFPQYPDF